MTYPKLGSQGLGGFPIRSVHPTPRAFSGALGGARLSWLWSLALTSEGDVGFTESPRELPNVWESVRCAQGAVAQHSDSRRPGVPLPAFRRALSVRRIHGSFWS